VAQQTTEEVAGSAPTQADTNGAPEGRLEVRNPATGELIATIDSITPADVAELVERGRRAQPGWEALGYEGAMALLEAGVIADEGDLFTLAPAVAYLASVMTLLVMPFAPGVFGFDMNS